MNGNWMRRFTTVVGGCVLLSVLSCGRDQELVSIQVQPATETFGASNIMVSQDAGLTVQLRALGTYIHPPVTKDITSQVTWASNDTQMMTVDGGGLLTAAGFSCGSTLVSATVNTNKSSGGISSSGAVVTGYMTGNVVCFSGSGGGTTGPTVTVTFLGTGIGSITSNPAGLSCTNTTAPCIAAFTSGTPVTVTAAPTGTFGGWGGCDSVDGTGLICTITSLTANRALTAQFN